MYTSPGNSSSLHNWYVGSKGPREAVPVCKACGNSLRPALE